MTGGVANAPARVAEAERGKPAGGSKGGSRAPGVAALHGSGARQPRPRTRPYSAREG